MNRIGNPVMGTKGGQQDWAAAHALILAQDAGIWRESVRMCRVDAIAFSPGQLNMADPYPPPDASSPLRVLLLGASGPGWYAASQEERTTRILPRLSAVCAAWQAMGARLIVTLDDDLMKVGQPADHDHTWYLVYQVPDLQTVSTMLHQFRLEVDGARLDRWFRLEAKICRPFFPVEAITQP